MTAPCTLRRAGRCSTATHPTQAQTTGPATQGPRTYRAVADACLTACALLTLLAVGGCDVTLPCTAEVPCPTGTFCNFEQGSCGDDMAFGICAAIPVACTLEYAPVCGCDGQTYSNACSANAAGVSIDHAGECVATCCDPAAEPGVGLNPPCVEGAACCADGQWACNNGDGTPSCPALGDVCPSACGGIAGLPCEAGEYCRLDVGECCCDFLGVCMPMPDICIELYAPVCGCDGQTYSNDCFAAAAGVSVDHVGECN